MRALVTGASRGIGLELCRQLSARGAEVIGVCQQATPELEALGVRVDSDVDVTLERDLAALAQRLNGLPLDLLINNAGIMSQESLDDLDVERIRQQLEVNALGPLRVTQALLASLGDGAKVAMITSRMGSITDNTSGGRYGYRMSKAALNMAGVSLAQDLRGRGVAVALLHPGFVRTDLTRQQGHIDTREAAEGLLARIDALTLDSSGGFWHSNGERLSW